MAATPGALHLVNGFPRRIGRVAIPDWERTGTAMDKGNFFSNGNSDIVLQNNDGSVALWDMVGTTIIASGIVTNPGPSWHVEGTAGGIAITPGSGSFTDAVGNVFTISAAGVAQENGSQISEGFGYAKLEYYNGTVYGQDATTGKWFRLDSDKSFSLRPHLVSSATAIPTSSCRTTTDRSRCGTWSAPPLSPAVL